MLISRASQEHNAVMQWLAFQANAQMLLVLLNNDHLYCCVVVLCVKTSYILAGVYYRYHLILLFLLRASDRLQVMVSKILLIFLGKLLLSPILKLEEAGLSKTMVTIYKTTQCQNPAGQSLKYSRQWKPATSQRAEIYLCNSSFVIIDIYIYIYNLFNW
jgi:hypothetical protein